MKIQRQHNEKLLQFATKAIEEGYKALPYATDRAFTSGLLQKSKPKTESYSPQTPLELPRTKALFATLEQIINEERDLIGQVPLCFWHLAL